MEHKRLRVTVVDMQPITPAIGGGRQRLLGLYHALGADIDCTYVGTYDWPGESRRDQQITPGLREIVVPLSDEHHAAAAALSKEVGGRTVIDIAFFDQVHLSPDFLRAAREHIAGADVVVFSHPWCFPPLMNALGTAKLVVYDSQNVEAVLRASLLDDVASVEPLLKRVAEAEYALCKRANLVLACSHADRNTFHTLYDIAWSKLRVVPNGVFAFKHAQISKTQRTEAKRSLGIRQRILALFVGSDYGPNNGAAIFISQRLAPMLPDIGFALVGGCCNSLALKAIAPNVIPLGLLDEDSKHEWMKAADIALNPLAEGSGTSIKMFDFMAAGVPVVTTAVGARGIDYVGAPPFVLTDLENFSVALSDLIADSSRRHDLTKAARRTVEDFYAWERISPALGSLLDAHSKVKERASSPYFSVVIPTYERHALLDCLMVKLAAQWERDFEVIVIDQSQNRWPGADIDHGFPLRYIHSEVKGAVLARNLGGFLALGKVIAYTDDDCEPQPDWLSNAKPRFRSLEVVGVEGIIRSDHLDDPDWRPVSNVGLEGIGFMTANLMVRKETFQQLNGFDIAFDRPHFREDTDFGWRMQALGKVPFAVDVEVFHPAQPRSIARESHEARAIFFEKDALLLKKHPERYYELFICEAHYSHTLGFWENLQRGMRLYDTPEPIWLRSYKNSAS
jgi:glycosyltransferase involved in cell wall biosynthesis